MNFFRSAFGILQKIGKSLMLPVSVLPAAGILLGVGSAKFAALPPLMSSVMAQAGGAIFGNLPLIFAVSVALGLTAGDGSAALAGVVGFAVLVATMGVMAPVVGYEPVQILGMPSIETGVFGGLVIGAVVGFLHQRYSRTKLPTWLGFFSGSRLIPILTAFAAVVTGIVMAYIWPPIGEQIARFSHWAAEGSPATAFGLYGLVERALIPFGLHHIWNAPFFFEVGSYLDPATGNVIKGEIYRFTAGDPTAGNLAGGYLFKMWGLPAAAIAIWHTAKPENRAKVGGIMISAAMTSFLTGITEPIEFSFLFVAPLLYGIHAVLAGAAYVIAVKLGIHHSTTFSHGLIDFVVLYPNAQRGWWLLWLGPLYALLYYTIFRALIVARDLKTPGREDDDAPSALGAAVAGVKAGIATANASMAAKLVAAFGGAPNIESLDACITRLRVELHDVSRGSVEALKALGATGVLTIGGGMQAIFGTRSEGLKNEMADYIAAGGTGAEVMLSTPSRDLLLVALGGADNVIGAAAVAHTRVRVQVRDDAAVDTGALERAGASGVQRVGKGVVHLIVGTDAAAWATTLGARTLAALALMVAVATSTLHAQRPLFASPEYEITSTGVRQSRFEAQALGRDTIVSTYPRAAREVHFKFALNGRDNEFPPGIEHTINLRPRGGEVVTPLYAFAVEPRPQLPRPEDANEGENGNARVTIRLDLRQVKRALTQRGWYKPPQGDTIRALARVTVIGDTDPLVWDVNAVSVGAPQDLTDADRDGIYEVTLPFRTEYLRPLDADGRAIWVRSADLSAFPELRSPDPLLDALYRLSLEELTQLMRDDGALAAGAKWPGVWTRDVALSSLLSLAIVVPEAVRISLMKKVDATGRIIQDTGTGGSWPISTDRMTWALAAWEVYAVTGDREWLRAAYAIIRRSAEADAHAALDVESGLLRGESSFLDWREQSYPRWMQPADIYQSLALGTNAVHYGAYEILHRMGMALGAPAGELNAWQMRAEGIRTGLATELWLPSLDRHAQFSYGRVSRARSPRYEALGESLAALTGAATAEHAARALAAAPRVPFGTPTFWPFIEGVPFYHNATIWPFVTAYDTWAAADARSMHPVERGLASVTRGTALFLTNKENLVAETGHFEGTALNSDRQLWSVAGALAMQYRVLFGLRFEVDRLRFAPVVPESYVGERELRGIKYRGATLTVRVRGWGACAAPAAVLDGVPITRAEIPATLTGAHLIEITLGESCHVTSGISGSSGSSGTSGSSALVATRFAPATPMAQVAGEGVRRVLQWDSIPGAAQYVVHRDGRPIDTLRVRALSVIAHDSLAEYQLEAIDELGTGSFLSEPQRVVTVMGVQEFVPRSAQRNLERASAPVAFRVRIATTGRYAVDALYSNGNGPINTEDKAAVRTLDVDGRESGVLVMPQRGAGAWELRGYSNPVLVTLPAGEHIFTVRWDARDENMNGAVSRALLHQLRITRLPNAR